MEENKKFKDMRFSTSEVETSFGVFVKQYKQKGKRYIYFYKEALVNINDIYMNAKCLTTKGFENLKQGITEEDIEIIKNAIVHYLPDNIEKNIHVINIKNNIYENYFKINFGTQYLLSDVKNDSIESLIRKYDIVDSLNDIEKSLIHYDENLIDHINAEYLLNGQQVFPWTDEEERICS